MIRPAGANTGAMTGRSKYYPYQSRDQNRQAQDRGRRPPEKDEKRGDERDH